MTAVLAILCTLAGLWLWVSNDLTQTTLSTALLCIAGVLAFIAALEAHYGSN